MGINTWLCIALLAALSGGVFTATVTCYDCWYHSTAAKFGDTKCNTKDELTTVKNKTCEGECSTLSYTVVGILYVKRDCEATCTEGPFDIANIGKGNRTCCTTDLCNNAIYSGTAINQASVVISGLAASAILFFNFAL